jgi:hypothetical protein
VNDLIKEGANSVRHQQDQTYLRAESPLRKRKDHIPFSSSGFENEIVDCSFRSLLDSLLL